MLTDNNKMVRFEGNFIKTLSSFKEPRKVRVMFEESFYNSQDESFRVICLERPLEGGKFSLFDTVRQISLQSYEACARFLHENLIFYHYLGEINDSIEELKETFPKIQHNFTDLINSCSSTHQRLFSVWFQAILKLFIFSISSYRFSFLPFPPCPHLWFLLLFFCFCFCFATAIINQKSIIKENSKKISQNEKEPLRLALETYMMESTYERLFEAITALFSEEDTTLNKVHLILSFFLSFFWSDMST